MDEKWNGKWICLLAAVLLLGGAACGSDDPFDGPDEAGDPLDEGPDGGGGTGGRSHRPPSWNGTGGTGSVPGLGGTLGTGGTWGIGGYATGGTWGVGGSGGHGSGKGSECAKGYGLLNLRKQYCAPVDSGYTDCEKVVRHEPAYVTVKEIAPRQKEIWSGTITETEEYRECVPVGTYVVEEDCSKLPADVFCFSPGPVELEVRERKPTKHTFVNLVRNATGPSGWLEIHKKYCAVPPDGPAFGAEPPDHFCDEVKTSWEVEIEIVAEGETTPIWTGRVGSARPVKVELPVGDYRVRESCDALPAAIGCGGGEGISVSIVEGGESRVELHNPVRLHPVTFTKEVEGCTESTCGGATFRVKIEPASGTAAMEYVEDGAWKRNAREIELLPGVPRTILLPEGSYVATEKLTEGFTPTTSGGDVQTFEVPDGAVVFRNVLLLTQCLDGVDNDGSGLLDCAEPACLENHYLGCSRDACYWSAYLEFKRVCPPGDAVCANAEFWLEIEGKDTIFTDTPSFAGSFLFQGGESWLQVPAPCGTYAVRVLAPDGYLAFDETFDLDVPSFYFPILLHTPGGPVPEDPEVP